jgi:uncharacterized protein YndB with AHSA1/START domain
MKPADTLKIHPQGDRELVIVRAFAAPQALVWDCHTKPELYRRWGAGPRDWKMPVCEIDLRVGGRYRFETRDDEGRQMVMAGRYLEIQAPERLVFEMEFEPSWYPGKEVNSAVFTEQDGLTVVTTTVRYESPEALKMVLDSPMESGLRDCFLKMDALLLDAGA